MLKHERGLTLVEIVISLGLIVILVTSTASTVISSQFLASYAKHRVQAMYVAQTILEQKRRLPFASILSVGSTSVTLDNKGTSDSTDDFMGSYIFTVSNSPSVYLKPVQVTVSWQEQITSGKVTMTETINTTIANESQLN